FFSLISLSISTIALSLSLKKEFSQKFNLDVIFLDECLFECLVDRDSNDTPDKYQHTKYRLFPNVVLTNNSSRPITLIDFQLNNEEAYTLFTEYGNSYTTTYQTNKTELGNGVIAFTTDNEEAITYVLNKKHMINPPITLAPYESATGILFFHYNQSLVGTNKLNIRTSRGIKTVPLTVCKTYVSKLKNNYAPPE
ncbi:hypothetical protein OUS07_002725, partial [Enterococcus hirae]|nr:hypothetical protein [Enterococcus hirae]